MGILAKVIASATALFLATSGASATEAVANFYKGKTIRLAIGAAAGGGYDAYARLIARLRRVAWRPLDDKPKMAIASLS
jgi:tripartite-type tricarboxylate transporter receptor subunit TctC